MPRKAETVDRRALRARSAVFRALGHPTRLLLAERLVDGARCVGDLAAAIGCDVSTTSRHLAQLRDARILEADRQGAQVVYRLRSPCVLSIFDCLDAVLDERPAGARGACRAPRT
jgi:ArsR family transcriptional regulator